MLEWHGSDRTLTVEIDAEDLSFSYESADSSELEGGSNDFVDLFLVGFWRDSF